MHLPRICAGASGRRSIRPWGGLTGSKAQFQLILRTGQPVSALPWAQPVLFSFILHSSFSFNKYFLYNYYTFIEKPYHFKSFKEVKGQQNRKRKFLMCNILVLKFVHLPRSPRGENNLWPVEFPFDSLTPFIIIRSLHPLLQGKSR